MAATPIKFLQVAKKLIDFQGEVGQLRVPDGLTKRRKALRDKSGELAIEAQQRALDSTHV